MSKLILSTFSLLLSLVLTSCASNPTPMSQSELKPFFVDQHFELAKTTKIESSDEIFKLDNELYNEIKESLSGHRGLLPSQKVDLLINEIIGRPNDDIGYSLAADLTASQAYLYKTANCLSLSIMVHAVANAAGIKATFREIEIPELWSSRDGYRLSNGHVNVEVKATTSSPNGTKSYKEVIDFAPDIAKKKFRAKEIGQQQVQALFYNNKSAHAIIAKDYDQAYVYLKAAIKLHPSYAPAWSNLGYVYKKIGLIELAEQTYKQAVIVQPKNLTALDNLVVLYMDTNRHQEAKELKSSLDYKRRENPYYHALKGDIAFDKREYDKAIQAYKKAVTLNAEVDIFYWGLAKSYFKQGKIEKAESYLVKAEKHADFFDQKKRFKNKLSALQHIIARNK